MQQSRTRISGVSSVAKIILVALLSLMGLTVIGVGQAAAASTQPTIGGLAAGSVTCGGSVTTGLSGVATGGAILTICGTNFGAAANLTTKVYFGSSTNIALDTPAPSVTVVSASRMTITVPAAPNATTPSTIFVNNPASSPTLSATTCGAVATACQYTYTWGASTPTNTPTISSVSPATGPLAGGTSVTITGNNLAGPSAVNFGSTPAASYVANSSTSITAVSPPGTGSVDITVTTPIGGGSTSPVSPGTDYFSYLTVPTVTGLRSTANPAGGPAGGGTQVLIDGTGFSPGTTVNFGATAATSVLVNSIRSITAIAPAGTGVVDVTVHTGLGTSLVNAPADQFTYNGTLAIVDGTAAYSSGPQSSTAITAPAPQATRFNALTLATGGTTFDPATLHVVTAPSSGAITFSGNQIVYTPVQGAPVPTPALPATDTTVWNYTVTTTGNQTAQIALCETGFTYPNANCATFTMTYLVSTSGLNYMGEQLKASVATVSVVLDSGAGISTPASAATGSTFTAVTAPPMALIPSKNSGFAVTNAGAYQAITPVPSGVTLVPGSLMVSGGDTATSGKYIVSYCTSAMGYVPGQCTARFDGNYKATYPYIETSLNAATLIPGGAQLSLPTITAQWVITATSGSIDSIETEFVTTTNVVGVGAIVLDAYPTDEVSYLNQGSTAAVPPGLVPAYLAPLPRWSVTVTSSGPTLPAVTSISPSTGPTAGGTSVTITGTGLTSATDVSFGATSAFGSCSANTATSITCNSPAGSAGAVDVTVTTGNGTSPVNAPADQFTYVAAPTVTGVSPVSGPTAGGTSVTITGTNLTAASGVQFGTNAGTSCGSNTATSITCTSPAGSAGVVDVKVTTAGGTSATNAPSDHFTYVAAPTVTVVSPSTGLAAGGDSVTITGTNLTSATAVHFGANLGTACGTNTSTSITCTSPAGTGTVDVTVTTVGGTSAVNSPSDHFTYLPVPAVTGVAPNSGVTSGGTSVVITGTNLGSATGVHFGVNSAFGSCTSNTATSITCPSPAGSAGTVDVTVTTAGGTSATSSADSFSYVTAPTVTGVSPVSGPTTGGTSVVITGTSFTGTTAVAFGTNGTMTYTVDSNTQITATAPAGAAGTIDVRVTNGVAQSAVNSPNDHFTYVAAPTVTVVSPSTGLAAGGDSVTITGTNLTGATDVKFGTASVFGSCSANTSTSITCTSPAGTGTVDVRVTTAGGTSAVNSPSDHFTYLPVPAVTGVAPNSGVTTGGTSVVITGTNLGSATDVSFGVTSAFGSCTSNTATSITCTSPAGSVGTVDVTVATAGGTSATSSADNFSYVTAPTVTGVSPVSGPTTGGTSVVITGTSFTGTTAVAFGTNGTMTYTVDSNTQITATAPAGAAGVVDVRVTNGVAQSAINSPNDHFTYVAAPTVTGISPSTGLAAGGDPVVITGTNLTAATAVHFGANLGTACGYNTATSITCNSPAGTGTVNVTVTTVGGTSAALVADQFTYIQVPAVTSVSPSAGPTAGGDIVTIAGTNLASATSVHFGANLGTSCGTNTATSITCTSPAGSVGTVDVTVTTAGGTSPVNAPADEFTYVAAPTITSLDVTSGSALGGDTVVITGTNLDNTSAVVFGSSTATCDPSTATTVSCTTPSVDTAGIVDVAVTTVGGTATASGAFTYNAVAPAAPTVGDVTPGNGSATVTWTPGLTGGAPIDSFTVTATPGGATCTVTAPATTCTVSNLTNGTPYTFTVLASNSQGPGDPSAPSATATPQKPATNEAISGYWLATSNGAVLTNGSAVSYGSAAGLALTAPIVALAPTPDRHGYWLVGSDGGVFSYGDAGFFGSTGAIHLNKPIVGMASTSDGQGYWLVAADGGVFAYGDAAFAGSTGGQQLNKPIVGIAGNGTGGYLLVASDGGVFAFGSASFHGSAGALTLASPVVGIAALANGSGYYMVGADGGVFAYGAAPFLGSAAGSANTNVVGITTGYQGGYVLASANGGVFNYGTNFYGAAGAATAPVVGIAA